MKGLGRATLRNYLIGVALLACAAGCSTFTEKKVVVGPDYQPSNVFRFVERLPTQIRRVAVLPLTLSETQEDAIAGQQVLEPILRNELIKAKKFEVVWLAPEQLSRWTGQRSWSANDTLPPNLLTNLQEKVACEAVLFCSLSRFKAYPPLAVGWHLKLVQVSDAQTLWAIDELFDSAEPPVSNSARRYEQEHLRGDAGSSSPLILTSPARFGRYTAATALSTLPAR